jgi:single-strand binding family protein
MQAFVTFEGGLVRKGELRQVNTANGSTSVINLTVARNYQKRDGNDWVDDGTYYINCTAWGKIAESIANSDIPTGFRLIISGVLTSRLNAEYTAKSGEVIPEHYEEEVRVDSIGVALAFNQTVVASRAKSENGGTTSTSTKQAAKSSAPKSTTPAPASTTDSSSLFGEEDTTVDEDFDALFGDL